MHGTPPLTSLDDVRRVLGTASRRVTPVATSWLCHMCPYMLTGLVGLQSEGGSLAIFHQVYTDYESNGMWCYVLEVYLGRGTSQTIASQMEGGTTTFAQSAPSPAEHTHGPRANPAPERNIIKSVPHQASPTLRPT